MARTQKVIGSFESVKFPEFPLADTVWAKIDTGAYTGALHCTKIREEDTPEGRVLYFCPFDHPKNEIATKVFAIKHVRSSNGGTCARYFVTTKIMIDGKAYPISLSLANRSEMKWPVLIGRRFLRQNGFLVDVNKKTNVS